MDETFNDLVMGCNNCSLKFLANELRVDPVSNTLVCINCLNFPQSRITILKDRPIPKKQPLEQKPMFLKR